MIISASFIDSADVNVAEAVTQPVDYFDFSDDIRKIAIRSWNRSFVADDVTAIVVGGSGIFNQPTWMKLREIVDDVPSSIPIVIWGMGINDHGRLDRNYDETLAYIEKRENVLIGLRDVFYKNYVPCVSCMRPEFEAKFICHHKVGLYVHQSHDISLDYPTMSNRLQGDPVTYMWRVAQFLGSCETVVTNTYHGAYWATLLNRKVIVVKPFSNKFVGFKYEPIIIDDISRLGRVLHLAKSYPGALDESRSVNRSFYQRVRAFQKTLARA